MKEPIDQRNNDKMTMFAVLFANDVACGALVEAVACLRRSGHYHQDIKRRVNQLDAFRKQYERRIKVIVGALGDRYMEMCDAYTESIRHDIDVFYWVFKQSYDKAGFADAEMLSHIQHARWFADIAAMMYHDLILTRYVRGRNYSYLNLRPMERMLSQLVRTYWPTADQVECEDGHIGAKALVNKMFNGTRIADAINAAAMEE